MKKKIIIALLLVIVAGMGVGYSILSSQLNVEGSATFDPNYEVKIVGFSEIPFYSEEIHLMSERPSINYLKNTRPSFTDTTATFDATFTSDNQELDYLLRIKNTGNVPSIIKKVNFTKTGTKAVLHFLPIDLTDVVLQPGEETQYIIRLVSYSLVEQNEGEFTANINISIDTQQFGNNEPASNNLPYIAFDDDSVTNEGCWIKIFNVYGADEYKIYQKVNNGTYQERTVSIGSLTNGVGQYRFEIPDNLAQDDKISIKIEANGKMSNEIIINNHLSE